MDTENPEFCRTTVIARLEISAHLVIARDYETDRSISKLKS